jgi:hypothetical protein
LANGCAAVLRNRDEPADRRQPHPVDLDAASSHEEHTINRSIERLPSRPTCSPHDRGQPAWPDSCSGQRGPTLPRPTATTSPPRSTSRSAYVKTPATPPSRRPQFPRASRMGPMAISHADLTCTSRPDLSSPSAPSSAPFSSTSSSPRKVTSLSSSASSTSTSRAPRTGRRSTLYTPRPWNRLASTETSLRTAETSTDSSMSHTPSSSSPPAPTLRRRATGRREVTFNNC